MVKRSPRALPLIAITTILLIQFGPISELNITPTALLSEDSNECLTFQNVAHNYNYSEPIQYSFNITADLVNNCAEDIMYPSALILNDTAGVDTSADTNNWRYLIEDGGSYPVSWQVDWPVYIPVGTIANFELHPTRDNCQENCSQNQSYSQNVSIALGPVDVNACYGVSNITHDYNASIDQGLFNLTAELTNNCWGGDIHYPAASMYNDTVGVTSSPPEGSTAIGQSAYMIYSYNSTFTNWQIYLDTSISNGTNVTFSIQPLCSVYTWSNEYYTSNYMQDCDITPLNPVNLTIQIGVVEEPESTVNTPPTCDVYWYGPNDSLADGKEGGHEADEGTETGDFDIELTEGATYTLMFYCMDAEGDELTVTVDPSIGETKTMTGNGTAVAYYELTIPTGFDGKFRLEAEWSDGATGDGTIIDIIVVPRVIVAVDIDADGDTVSDSDDRCPGTASGEIIDASGCSDIQRDSDGDGYLDTQDLCDNTPKDSDFYVYNIEANGCANLFAPWSDECRIWEYWNPDNINTEEFGRGCPHFDLLSGQDYNDVSDNGREADAEKYTGFVPGFGILLAITASLGAALVAIRRE